MTKKRLGKLFRPVEVPETGLKSLYELVHKPMNCFTSYIVCYSML